MTAKDGRVVTESGPVLKATQVPSSLITGCSEAGVAVPPKMALAVTVALLLAHEIPPPKKSRTYTSPPLCVTPRTRVVAVLTNATYLPFVLIARLEMIAPVEEPVAALLIETVVCATKSRRKMSGLSLPPPARLVEVLMNATYRPSGVMTG